MWENVIPFHILQRHLSKLWPKNWVFSEHFKNFWHIFVTYEQKKTLNFADTAEITGQKLLSHVQMLTCLLLTSCHASRGPV